MALDKDCFTFNWQIENFRVLINTPIELESPVFQAHKIKWFLRLHTTEMVDVYLCRSQEDNIKSITIGISTEMKSRQTISVEYIEPHETSDIAIPIQRISVENLKDKLNSRDLQIICTIFAFEMNKSFIPLLPSFAFKEEYTAESIGTPIVVARPSAGHAVTRIHVMKSTVMFDVPPISAVNQEKSFYFESSLRDWVSLRISVLRKPKVDEILVRIRRVVLDYSKWTSIQVSSHLIDRFEGQFYRNSYHHCFGDNQDFPWEFSVDIFSASTKSKKKEKLNKAIEKKPGCLRIYLEILVSQEGCYRYSRQDTAKCNIDIFTLSLQRDLSSMLKLIKSRDTHRVASDDQNIQVHAYILRARSSVFDRMLTSDMQERKHRKINLRLDKTAIEALIAFLYSGFIQLKTTEVAYSLLSAGHMYQLTGLIEMCTDFLINNRSVKSVFDVLTTANFLEDFILFENTRKLLVSRYVDAFHSEKWRTLDWNPWLKLEFSLDILREGMQFQNLDSLIELLKQKIALLEN